MFLVKTLLESGIHRALTGQELTVVDAPRAQSWVCRDFPEMESVGHQPAVDGSPLIAECCDPDAALMRVRDIMVVDGNVVSLGGCNAPQFIFEA